MERLLELEREQAVLVSRLAEEQAALLDYSRDDFISAASLYRKGNIEDKAFQARLFDAFLVAVYLYDDHFKLEFNITGKKNLVDVPLDASLVDSIESNAPAGCSYKVSFGPPNKAVQILRSGRLSFVFFRISRELRTYCHIIFAIILQRWQLKKVVSRVMRKIDFGHW